MTMIPAHELADCLEVSRGRVSQYVSEGKLDGCFQGEGRKRRFDLQKVAQALGKSLHPGQLMGNGAATKQALASIEQGDVRARQSGDMPVRQSGSGALKLDDRDPDRYELARIQKAEEEARKLRRQNAEAEGQYVLASEVSRQVARQIAQEIAEFESVLREGARKVADKLGVDAKVVRAELLTQWRSHRKARTEVLTAAAASARASEDEAGADI